MDEDYQYHYRLDAKKPDEAKVYADPLVELIRAQLEQLLNLVVLTCQGQDVKVDGFKPLNTPTRVYKIFRHGEDVTE